MSDKKPNILIVLLDCLRWDRAAGEQGEAVIPTLTELREEGTSFDTTLSAASCTTPSVAAMLSGLYPQNNGVLSMRGYRYRKDVRPLASVLADNGYHCRAEMTGPLVPEVGLGRGFHDPVNRHRCQNVFSPFGDRLLDLVRGGLPEPWFLFVHVWALHRPRKILRKYSRRAFGEYMYDRSLSSLDTVMKKIVDATPMDDTIFVTTGDHGERMQKGDFSHQSHRIVSPVKAWEESLDKFKIWRRRHRPKPIRRMFKIEGEGAYHGFHVHDYLTRVPWFLTGGPFPSGLRIDDQVRTVDMMPTLLDAVGIEDDVTGRLDGRSVMPLVRGESMPELPAYMEATGLNLGSNKRWRSGLRTSEWKYSRLTKADDPEEELYDMKADPTEQTNLVAERPEIATMMNTEMEKVLEGSSENLETMSEKEKDDLDDLLRDLGYVD